MKLEDYIKSFLIGATIFTTAKATNAESLKMIQVNSDRNIRDAPTLSGKKIGTLKKGSTVKILDEIEKARYTWAKIQDVNGDGKEDYVAIKKGNKLFGKIIKTSQPKQESEYKPLISVSAVPDDNIKAISKRIEKTLIPFLEKEGYKVKTKNIAKYIKNTIDDFNKEAKKQNKPFGYRSGIDIIRFGLVGDKLEADILTKQIGERSKPWKPKEMYALTKAKPLEKIVTEGTKQQEVKRIEFEYNGKKFYTDKRGNLRRKDSVLGLPLLSGLNPNDIVMPAKDVQGKTIDELENYIKIQYAAAKAKKEKAEKKEVKKEEKYEVAKSTAIKPSKISVGVIYSAGKPVNLVGISTEYGSKKAGIGTSIAVSQGKAILEQETVPGTRFNAYGEKTYSNAMELAADARLGPFKLGYAIEIGEMNIDEKILNKTGNVLALNKDTYMNKDRKIRCGLQFGLGKGWYLNGSRDLTGTNRRTTFGVIKRLGGYNRTTHK